MVNEHLATYLNDHLAGSVAAIELLEHLQAAYGAMSWSIFSPGSATTSRPTVKNLNS